MKSDLVRLLRQWWNDPGDYMWLTAFLDARGFLGLMKAFVGVMGLSTAAGLACFLDRNVIRAGLFSHAVMITYIVLSVGWALAWWCRPWPGPRRSALFMALADSGIVSATLLHAEPLDALAVTPMFAVSGTFIVFFFGPRANVAHLAVAASTITAVSIWLACSGRPGAVAVAVSSEMILLLVVIGVQLFMQVATVLVRSSSVDSFTDPLTELANRRGMANFLERNIDKIALSAEPLCAFVIDLDAFKKINDEYGHKAGDAVIVRTAEQIRAALHPLAFVARTGGEEFVVVDLLPVTAAVAMAERVRAAIEALDAPRSTASIGVAVGSIGEAGQFDAIHASADDAMYAAKRGGGNRVAVGGEVSLTSTVTP